MFNMRMPTEYQCSREILGNILNTERQRKSGGWVPARPMAMTSLRLIERLRRTWKVFTGKADILEWIEDE